MRTIYWQVTALGTPDMMRHCKKCGGERAFGSSGLFRVNANHHVLDVWLIYRCKVCEATWKMAVEERVRPRALEPALLYGYQRNDGALAERVAHDRALHAKSRAVARYDAVPLAVEGPAVPLEALEEPVRVVIACAHALDVRISRIFMEKTGLSGTAYRKLVEAGRIQAPGLDLKKARFVSGMEVMILPEA